MLCVVLSPFSSHSITHTTQHNTTIVMDGSRVTQGLDFLWFYTNVLTCSAHDPVPALSDQCSSPSLQNPNTPSIVNQHQHHESHEHHAEDFTQRCPKCGEVISSAFEVERVMHGGNSEMKSGEETKKKRDRRKRRKKLNKSGLNGTEVILGGGLDLGFEFDAKRVHGFLKFHDESYEYEIVKTKLPPFDDDVAMKQHLKSWAYAVACTVK